MRFVAISNYPAHDESEPFLPDSSHDIWHDNAFALVATIVIWGFVFFVLGLIAILSCVGYGIGLAG